jgi:replicative DNA helicase
VGKSLWLGNIAANTVMAGHNVAVITLEMSEAKYLKRLGSNLLNIKIDEYKRASHDEDFLRDKLKNLSGHGGLTLPGQLFVKEFPTSTASAVDIENYLLRTEEKNGIKFKVVVIDYLNIMKNWRNPNTENTYMKIKQIAEDVRAMAQRNNWAIISATQTKQAFFDSSDMNMSAASESSALAATVDLMFGIIQDPIMLLNKKYKLKVLANRDEGYKNSSKMFDVNYAYMRITEDPTAIMEG